MQTALGRWVRCGRRLSAVELQALKHVLPAHLEGINFRGDDERAGNQCGRGGSRLFLFGVGPASRRAAGHVQLNVLLPESLRKAAKMQALQEDRDLSEVIEGLLRKWLGK
jgi:hypothetical protein